MILIKGKANTGKTTELVKRFCESENAVFLSDDMTIESIIKLVKREGFEQKGEYKLIKNAPTYDYDFWQFVYTCDYAEIFLDIHSSWFTKNILFYMDRLQTIERQIGQKFVLTVQLNALDDLDNNKLIVETI
jgi:hypothetical protein